MDTVQAPGTAWAHGDGMKEMGESREVSGRGMGHPEARSPGALNAIFCEVACLALFNHG